MFARSLLLKDELLVFRKEEREKLAVIVTGILL